MVIKFRNANATEATHFQPTASDEEILKFQYGNGESESELDFSKTDFEKALKKVSRKLKK